MTTYQNQNFPCHEVTSFLSHKVMLIFAYSLSLCPLKFAFCYTGVFGEHKGSHLSSTAW